MSGTIIVSVASTSSSSRSTTRSGRGSRTGLAAFPAGLGHDHGQVMRVQPLPPCGDVLEPARRAACGAACSGRLAASHSGQSMVIRMLTLDSAATGPVFSAGSISRPAADDPMDGARVLSSPPRRSLAVALVAALAGASFHAAAAHADTVLDHKRARYAHVRAEIRHLDNHAEMLTEQYDKVVWQLGVLRRRMRIATHRLIVERAKLHYEQGSWAARHRAVQGRRPAHDRDRARGVVARPGDGQHGSEAAPGHAVADTVAAIDAAKHAIVAERSAIAAAQVKERADKRQIIVRRREIRRELRRRHRLVGDLGRQITVMTAADRIGQADLALEAPKWLKADLKADVADPGQELRDQVALEALQQIGVPYVWGGASPSGFDCSGLVMWLWANHGVALPHFAASQYHMGPLVTPAELRPGDLVFFHHLDHVAIYIGNGWVVHAPHTGDWVRMKRFSLPWFQATYVGATQPGPA